MTGSDDLDPATDDRRPLRRIVVGVDFSPCSDDAIGHALAVARREGAPVTLVHVGQLAEAPAVPASMAIPAHAYREVMLERLARDRARLAALRELHEGQGVEISQAVYEDVPASGVAAAARDLGADLIVTGSHGRTGLRRALLGSVAEHTVRLATASVLVARGPAPAAGYRRIVVGADFSPRTDLAVERALAMAAPDAEIDVVHCWEPPAALGDDGDLDTMAGHLRSRSRRALRVLALEEAPDRGLAHHADRVSADLLVVASHGRRGLDRMLLGSVAEATVRRATCSVLVAR
jgi:nucleotide-binding universal stress UspA family protein